LLSIFEIKITLTVDAEYLKILKVKLNETFDFLLNYYKIETVTKSEYQNMLIQVFAITVKVR
jgi:hypothetical protein